MLNAVNINRLLQLCSANLPVGGFSFSQGLEYAIDHQWLSNAQETSSWICVNMQNSIARTDLAIIKRLYSAFDNRQTKDILYWNQHLIACRESNELLLADLAMGKALVRLLRQLDNLDATQFEDLFSSGDVSFVSAFACAAYLFEIKLYQAQGGYIWTVLDSQVAAATKLVPLGQTQAQNMLFDLSLQTDDWIDIANHLSDDEIGGSLPHLAMASAWHETQYSRLFRS